MAAEDQPRQEQQDDFGPKSTGIYRTCRRHSQHWEVWFKNFRTDIMVLIAFGLDRDTAETLKDKLNNVVKEFCPRGNHHEG